MGSRALRVTGQGTCGKAKHAQDGAYSLKGTFATTEARFRSSPPARIYSPEGLVPDLAPNSGQGMAKIDYFLLGEKTLARSGQTA